VLTSLRLDNLAVPVNYRNNKTDTGLLKLGSLIGNNTQIGANVVIQPGILVGTDCFISPGVLLEKNLPDKTFCRFKQQLETKENLTTYTPNIHLQLKQKLIETSL